MKRNLLCVTMTAGIVSGCASGFPGLRPLTYQEPGDTRLIVSYADCPNTPNEGRNFAPILATVALSAASKLLEGFGTALSEGAKGGKLPASVQSTNIEIADGQTPRCLIAIRGDFSPSDRHATPLQLPQPEQPVLVNEVVEPPLKVKNTAGELISATLPSVYDLQHYVEMQLVRSQNASALTFAPVVTKIARSMDGGTNGSRELSVAISFQRPGQDPKGGAVLLNDLQIGSENRNRIIPETGRYTRESPWFAGIPASAARAQTPPGGSGGTGSSGGAVGAGGTPPAATGGAASEPAAAGPIPYTVSATVIETRPTKEFLAFVASVFTAVRPSIDSELKRQIDPATVRAAESTALDTAGKYQVAYSKARATILQYCAMDASDSKKADRLLKSGEASNAQYDANEAALAADIALPFTTYVVVSEGSPAAANARFCSAA